MFRSGFFRETEPTGDGWMDGWMDGWIDREKKRKEEEVYYRNWLKWLWRPKVSLCTFCKPENRKCWCPRAEEGHLSAFLFRSDPQRNGRYPSALGRAIFFIQSTHSSADLFGDTSQTHPEMMFYQLPGHP